jgi:short-subunit dehydrogenase
VQLCLTQGGAIPGEEGVDLTIVGPAALIVGGSTGIGAAIAERLAGDGVDLILTGRSIEALEKQRSEILLRHKVDIDLLADDITSDGAVERLCDFVAGRDLGLVAYIAGTVRRTAFFDQSLDEARATLRLNAGAPLELFHRLGKDLVRRNRGSMLLTSSLAGLAGTANMAVYSASKAFGQMLMESLWAELRDTDVNVLSLIVHATATQGAASIGAKLSDDSARRVMTPDEVAETALANLQNGPTVWAGADNFASADQFCTKDRRAAAERVSARLNRLWTQ